MIRKVKGLKWAALLAILSLIGFGPAGDFNAQEEPQVEARAPMIRVSESLEPAEIFVKGSGDLPEIATVTLKLESPPEARLPADVILIVDRSATVDIKEMARIGSVLLDRLLSGDRAGLVSFATEARVDVELTTDWAEVKRALGRLRALGKTAVGEGIALATDELINKRREEALAVEILLTDGRSNTGRDAISEAKRAAENEIRICPIGVSRMINRAVLSEIARLTGCRFFERFSPEALELIRKLPAGVEVREIKITKTLPKGINFEGAVTRPPRVKVNPDGSTTLEWDLERLMPGETWTASFQISASAPGELKINQDPSTVTFIDARGNRVTQPIPTQTLRVLGQPIADFSFSPPEPRAQETIQFTDHSRDTNPAGYVVSWSWDFGDGTRSTKQNPTHTYAKPGDYTVTLTVTDNDKLSASASKAITVLREKVTATRDINTYLPNDTTLAGETFRVTVTITIDRDLKGLGLDEDLPSGWEVTTVESAGAVFRKEEIQWVFVEAIPAGETRTIIYDVKVKEDEKPRVFKLGGVITSAAPTFSSPVAGENNVTILASLPIRVVVAKWDVETSALNLQLPDKISFDQIQVAVAWWVEGTEVPKSGGKKIDFKTIQELIAYWLTETSVFEPLPK